MSHGIIDHRGKFRKGNLDATKHGTFAEIGAGQEVARWFFHVGGAAGTVAKTISAYDMAVSDELFRHQAIRMLARRGRPEEDAAAGLLSWRHSGRRRGVLQTDRSPPDIRSRVRSSAAQWNSI